MYCFTYRHDGATWGINIACYDAVDAEARAKLLNLTLDGELVGTCPVDSNGDPDTAQMQYEPGWEDGGERDLAHKEGGPTLQELKLGLLSIEESSREPDV